ncbi:MAG: tetratricopeptide repeat protein [Acidobacteriia bacterium]|nr:tetratricopeptide repeat protein [Terriglobia bacterium]
MADLDKLFEKAEKYLHKQKFESALETYQEIYKYSPQDEEVLLNLGDLNLKLNRTADGLRFQSLLVDFYSRRNDVAKAVATCRKMVKVTPQDAALLVKLANLLERSQKNSEALEAFREALALYRKARATDQAIDCLQHLVKLDASNLEAHVELGDLANKSDQPNIATPAYLRAAALAREAGDEGRWAELAERGHLLDPSDESGCIAAAEVYLKKQRATEAVALLEPLLQSKPDDNTVLDLLGRSYLATGDFEKAAPVCWKLYQTRPEALDLLVDLTKGLLHKGSTESALNLVGKLKERLFRQNKRNEYLKMLEQIYESDESNLQVLEMLSGLYNEMNKEDGLRRSLTRLFNLYLGAEQYDKAADTLERIIDVEPYGEGHFDRLLNLEGHIDPIWYRNILSRLQPSASLRASVASGGDSGSAAPGKAKTESLEDLIVEGEMYYQYQLSSKLSETLEKINRLYPGVEDRSPRLRELYDLTGFTPKAAPGTTTPEPSPPPPPKAEPVRAAVGPSPESLEDLRKIAEITASIYRESTAQGVLQVAVNQIGRALSVSRCWGAWGGADRPPVLSAEYCSPAASASDAAAAIKLYAALMRQAVTNPDGWALDDAARAPVLVPVRAEVQILGINSLLAVPLLDRDEAAGLLVLEHCEAPHHWNPSESLPLKALATQVVIAVNNTKLRRLVRSLAGTDPETGLLPRSSYLDCLLAEAQRSHDQSQPLSVCLFEPENPTSLVKLLGDTGVQRYIQQLSKALLSALRQNDIAIRYSPLSVAVVFPDTALPQGGLAVEKVRRAISEVKADGASAPNICAVVCDVPLGPHFDAVDGVTEVINRLESALDQARKEGGQRVLLSKFAD